MVRRNPYDGLNKWEEGLHDEYFADEHFEGHSDLELHARSSDPPTSHAAMETYDVAKMESAIECVVALYKWHGPMADYQLKDLFAETWRAPCSAHLYRQARSVARDRGYVVDTHVKVVNPFSNRKQILWAYCEDRKPMTIHRCPECGKLIGRGTREEETLEVGDE